MGVPVIEVLTAAQQGDLAVCGYAVLSRVEGSETPPHTPVVVTGSAAALYVPPSRRCLRTCSRQSYAPLYRCAEKGKRAVT
jgi:hypothetical protein